MLRVKILPLTHPFDELSRLSADRTIHERLPSTKANLWTVEENFVPSFVYIYTYIYTVVKVIEKRYYLIESMKKCQILLVYFKNIFFDYFCTAHQF